ncbi:MULTISPECIES: thioredoxin-dependent thiol peroxidase [Planococcus]|uniref:thioredoxin-dependent peroxiredoxin n=1 Tax=Planococcus faecalis TaxID=1598147 RepID=A0ABN4XGB7_9BACL|nr:MULTISPECIES: thioredoxin-dependent thiol peroxidase [Planococcus]AQU78686.1 thioredoxin-dependent thiol peroxidase [Planococcus faecalis]MDJ0332160.1 thioredoxin-dependent thiol peroxidase [Planococcus sp. S3-L1]
MSAVTGVQAPDFSLKNEAGETVSLKDFSGSKYVVLYFYPKDMTPGCTTQACDFRDSQADFSALNAVILGVSADSEDLHNKFIEKHGLPFSLLVDEDHQVSEKYGVWVEKNMYGKKFMGIERATYLIDPTGTIVNVWRKVKVPNHIQDVLETLKTISDQ